MTSERELDAISGLEADGFTRSPLRSDEVVEGEVVGLELADRALAVARYQGAVYAFDDMCSHQDCPLSTGFVEDCQIECECHGAMFSLETGEATLPPATEPIAVHRAVERDGYIFIRCC